MESWQPLAAYLADMCSKPVGKVDIFVWECLPQCMCLWERAPSTMFFFHQPSAPSFGCATGFENPQEISEAFWWLNCHLVWIVIFEFYGIWGRLYISNRMERTKQVTWWIYLLAIKHSLLEPFSFCSMVLLKKHVAFYGWWGPSVMIVGL